MTTRRAERVEEIHAMGRLIAERKLAAIARRRARAAVGETASRLKDEVAKQVAQIDDDRAYAVRPTFQIPANWKCTHLNAPTEFYKVVACVNERFVSVYDGATEYELGRWYQTKRGARGRRSISASSRSAPPRRARGGVPERLQGEARAQGAQDRGRGERVRVPRTTKGMASKWTGSRRDAIRVSRIIPTRSGSPRSIRSGSGRTTS